MKVEEIKKDFPLLENSKIAYLDSGATTQKPNKVIEKVEEFYKKYNANPHRGAYSLSVEATSYYEETRKKIAKFINSPSQEQIIFTKNATESLNLIAYSYGMENLKKDDEITISIMEHHSNLVPWQKVSKVTKSKLNYIYLDGNYELDNEEINEKEATKKINEVYKKINREYIDVFLCGGVSTNSDCIRDKVRRIMEENYIRVLYPEDMFMDILAKNRDKDLLSLEKFLADNSDIICVLPESAGSFVELGAFTNNNKTIDKLFVMLNRKYEKDKSFIIMGPVKYIINNMR